MERRLREKIKKVENNLKRFLPEFEVSKIAYLLTFGSNDEEIDLMANCELTPETIDHAKNVLLSRWQPGGGADVYPLGLAMSTFLNAQKIQETLNVKHINTKEKINYLVPRNIFIILHKSTDQFRWIRVKVTTNIESKLQCVYYYKINEDYYEYYYKLKDKKKMIEDIERLDGMDEVLEVIFISDLRLVKSLYPMEISYAMILTFLTSYWGQTPDINLTPQTSNGIMFLQILAYIFLFIDNLNCSPNNAPLMKTSTERSLMQLNKNVNGNVYSIETPRCFANIGESIGSGARSTIEHVFPIDLTEHINQYVKCEKTREILHQKMEMFREEIVKTEKEINNTDVVFKESYNDKM